MRKMLTIGLMLSHLAFIPAAFADAEKGLQIAQERKARDIGWGDSQSNSSMILRNSQGQETERKIRVKNLEVLDDGDKGLTIFDQPRDVKGSAFLNFSHAIKPDEQWIYLPALKRVKRISSRNKSGPFMGSEFAYEDLSSFELEKFSFSYLRDETIDGVDMFVLEQTPTDKYSGYTKQVVWVDKEHYRAFKIEYYDRKNALLKTLLLKDFKLYKDKYWRPMLSQMENHQNGKSTDLVVHSIEFDTGLNEKDFNQATLKRAR
jgi:outer membrane lipoprotein-sorting protein